VRPSASSCELLVEAAAEAADGKVRQVLYDVGVVVVHPPP
jgi:hypothetical protein